MADRVASLTTIGTPHLGTSLADVVLDEKRGRDLIALLKRAIDLSGFIDLTSTACREFNELVRNAEATNGVFYQTYSSWEERELVFAVLQQAWDVIEPAEGTNDGLCSVASQKWQAEIVGDGGEIKRVEQHEFPFPADHLNQVGWWEFNEHHGRDAPNGSGSRREYEAAIKQIYLNIAEDLRARFPA
jgi:triacylglycerol lipase